MSGACQVAHCLRSARVELAVEDGLVLDVCKACATEETVKAFQLGGNIAVYSYLGARKVLACEGTAPIPREVKFVSGVPRWCEGPPTWSAYMIPCSVCREEFVFDLSGRVGRASLVCANCDSQVDLEPTVEPSVQEDDVAEIQKPPWGDGKPLWDQLDGKRMQQAAEEAYEERAAIMEYDGEQPRAVAEQKAYEEVTEKAVEAKLVTHEQLGLFG